MPHESIQVETPVSENLAKTLDEIAARQGKFVTSVVIPTNLNGAGGISSSVHIIAEFPESEDESKQPINWSEAGEDPVGAEY